MEYSGPDNDKVIKTYRYLRIGMVLAGLLLGAAIWIERAAVDCWQTSISAYYYTPVRAIFVGVLMAIGLSLIVVKGTTWLEDVLLNVAGMFAPMVAIVPISDVGLCWSVAPRPLPVEADGGLADWVIANIDNNVKALLFAGFAGVVVTAVIASIAARDLRVITTRGPQSVRLGMWLILGLLIVIALAFYRWADFDRWAHDIAAIGMFGFLAAAAFANAAERRRPPIRTRYRWLYGGIAALMVAAAIVLVLLRSGWDHMLLVLEMTEITLFVAFWVLQTIEHWKEVPGDTDRGRHLSTSG